MEEKKFLRDIDMNYPMTMSANEGREKKHLFENDKISFECGIFNASELKSFLGKTDNFTYII